MPNRSISRPPSIDPIGQPIDIAATAAPASTGVPPWTPWTSGGTYVVRPYITTPVSDPIARPPRITGMWSKREVDQRLDDAPLRER